MSESNQLQGQAIKVEVLCLHYQVETTFFQQLNEIGLIEIRLVDNDACVEEQHIALLDKMVRLHQDLEINPQGLDVVLNLLDKITSLEESLTEAQNRLALFE